MNRRHFLGTAGAFAGTVIPSYSAPAPGTGQRNRISLNGTWDQSVAGERLREVLVPSSLRPSGSYALSRRLPPLKLGAQERAILHFEAIALLGRASCNGQALGEMNPYVPYEFDITSLLRERDNTVKVDLVDLVPEATVVKRQKQSNWGSIPDGKPTAASYAIAGLRYVLPRLSRTSASATSSSRALGPHSVLRASG